MPAGSESFVGALNTDNVIKDNKVRRNKPADLADRGAGRNNTFLRNDCQLSDPAGMC